MYVQYQSKVWTPSRSVEWEGVQTFDLWQTFDFCPNILDGQKFGQLLVQLNEKVSKLLTGTVHTSIHRNWKRNLVYGGGELSVSLAIVKRGKQKIHLLRKLNYFSVIPVILCRFYQSFIESLLSFSFICWFHSLTVKHRNSLNSIVHICSKITGVKGSWELELTACSTNRHSKPSSLCN